ncbi:sigma factor [uncultured Fibrobacter sp.]|uniref:sigma factor n=1 Tax=uncultured Fibrobacter sp. TaxID=261512 RepID=UPI0025EA3461|nr:sigma factor [uncultured Fibrobacter sp.]
MAKKSYLLNSDFSLWGCSPAERRENLAGNAYMLFCKAVSDFEPSRKVPFAAYIAKIGKWRMLDEKRKNAKRSKREELDRPTNSDDCDEESSSRIDNCDVNPFTGERNIQDCDFEKRDFVNRIKESLAASAPKALHRFDIIYELCSEGNYSDAEAARRIGCERANMKSVKKNLRQTMAECGLEEEFRQLMAA